MRQNAGTIDRVIRALLGVVLTYAAFSVAGIWTWIAGVAAAIMFVTALIGLCPLYVLFGINTCPMRVTAPR